MEKIIYSKWFFKLILKKDANAYAPFPPLIFVNMTKREREALSPERLTRLFKTINHERIHHAQMRELGLWKFYWLYFKYYIKLFSKSGKIKAYIDTPFEREAYFNSYSPNYVQFRQKNAWKSYIV